MPNRKAAEEFILKYIGLLTPKSSHNVEMYKKRFAGMSDKDFDQYMGRLDRKEEILMVTIPNHMEGGLDIERNFKIGDELGHSFFTKITISGKSDVPDHETPVEHIVVDLPIRRLSQTIDKKAHVPKDTKVVDSLTGQVTGESKGSQISATEVQVLSAMGLESMLVEALKYRGGDRQGRTAFNGLIAKYGETNLATLSKYQNGVDSTATVRTFLTAAHLVNNL